MLLHCIPKNYCYLCSKEYQHIARKKATRSITLLINWSSSSTIIVINVFWSMRIVWGDIFRTGFWGSWSMRGKMAKVSLKPAETLCSRIYLTVFTTLEKSTSFHKWGGSWIPTLNNFYWQLSLKVTGRRSVWIGLRSRYKFFRINLTLTFAAKYILWRGREAIWFQVLTKLLTRNSRITDCLLTMNQFASIWLKLLWAFLTQAEE